MQMERQITDWVVPADDRLVELPAGQKEQPQRWSAKDANFGGVTTEVEMKRRCRKHKKAQIKKEEATYIRDSLTDGS